MSRRAEYDPLRMLPEATVVRTRLASTRRLADRLAVLLAVVEAVEKAGTDPVLTRVRNAANSASASNEEGLS